MSDDFEAPTKNVSGDVEVAANLFSMESFIESVRDVKCLWDTSDLGYKEPEIKEAHWEQLGRLHNFPSGKVAKRQWKKLRDSFREALKRQKEWRASAPATASDRKPWKYQHQMQFLIPYMKNRHGFDQKPETYTVNSFQLVDQYETISSSPISPQNPLPLLTKIIKTNNNVDVITQHVISQEEETQPPTLEKEKSDELSGSDELKDFFSSMYLSTKNLPPFEQLRIKRILFAAVVEAQERNMSNSHSATPATFVSYSAIPKPESNDFQGTTNKGSYSEIHGINFIESDETQQNPSQLFTFKIED